MADGRADRAAPPDRSVVRLDGISVRFRVPFERHVTLKEWVLSPRVRRTREHVALDAVDLAVGRGEVLGVIGRNGAGKTTLLNVIARIVDPTAGRLRTRGRIAALIDLLGGFHSELTGRENALLRGALLGVPRATMLERYASVAAFAGLGDFADAPMRTWSSGMVLRMAFAIATSVDADTLLVDEALGVGDAGFQARCAARIDEFRARGVTFIVVSHDLPRLAAMADRILWLDEGRARLLGRPDDVVRDYARSLAT